MKFIYKLIVLLILSSNFLISKELNDNPLIHYVGINTGSTTIFNSYTSMHLGLNYELKKHTGRLGIGFFGDYVFGPGTEILFGFPVSMHKVFGQDLMLSFAPGFGITSSLNYVISETSTEPNEDKFLSKQTRLNFLIRGSVAWEFPLKNSKEEFAKITPYLNIDLIANYKTYLSLGAKVSIYVYK